MVAKRRVLITILLLFLIIVISVSAALLGFLHTSVVSNPQGVNYLIRQNQSVQSVIEGLHRRGIINHPHLFSFLIRYKGDTKQLKSGEYLFPYGTTPLTLLNQITTGKGVVHHEFTIIAGWNFKQVREALHNTEYLQHTTDNLTDQQIMKLLGYEKISPEGQFFPDTYFFSTDSQDIKLLKRSFKAMQDKFSAAWVKRSNNLPYNTPYQALIVASLIEKEAHFDVERPIVAGVIVNRLNKDMRLQIDAAVIYGLGSQYDGTIYKKNLQKDTPYNTYLHKGLPPTPIAMPGMSSINAALHPESNKFIFYVASGGGYHQFSETLIEHNDAVAIARKSHPAFFNVELIRHYLVKRFSALSLSAYLSSTHVVMAKTELRFKPKGKL